MLALIFHIHDGARGMGYKLGQILLRPAFFFPLTFDFLTQGMKINIFFVLVHPLTSFYISRANMRTKHNFILWLSLLFSWARKRYGQGQAFQQGRAKVAAAKTKGILIQIRLGTLVSSVGQPFL